jgi:hypothetical protein
VEQHGLDRYKPRVYLCFGNQIIPWTSHLRTGRTLIRRAFETVLESGDVSYAAYSCINMVTNLLAAGDALNDVQRECERGLEFATIVKRAEFWSQTHKHPDKHELRRHDVDCEREVYLPLGTLQAGDESGLDGVGE